LDARRFSGKAGLPPCLHPRRADLFKRPRSGEKGAVYGICCRKYITPGALPQLFGVHSSPRRWSAPDLRLFLFICWHACFL